MEPMEYLPVFVYGTLRTGEGNWQWALQGKTVSDAQATLAGVQMYDQGGFPFVMRGEDASETVVGDLMEIEPDLYDKVMGSLDSLEGYTPGSRFNLYDRDIVTVTTADGIEHRAYVYLVAKQREGSVRAGCPRIESGDWIDFDSNRPVETALFMR